MENAAGMCCHEAASPLLHGKPFEKIHFLRKQWFHSDFMTVDWREFVPRRSGEPKSTISMKEATEFHHREGFPETGCTRDYSASEEDIFTDSNCLIISVFWDDVSAVEIMIYGEKIMRDRCWNSGGLLQSTKLEHVWRNLWRFFRYLLE
jgi:hypothetical protein